MKAFTRVAVFALAALAAALAAVEIGSGIDRDAGAPQREAEEARRDAGDTLLRLARRCTTWAREAAAAVEAASSPSGRFAALGRIGLPPWAGIEVLDPEGRPTAWAGAELGALPPVGTCLVESATGRRIAHRTAFGDGFIVTHCAHEAEPPLRHPLIGTGGIADRVLARHRVAAIDYLPPDGQDGVAVTLPDGSVLARIRVSPLSAGPWEALAADSAARRRAPILAAAVLVLAIGGWFAAAGLRDRSRLAGAAVRLAVVACAWWGLGSLSAVALSGGGALIAEESYFGALGASPVGHLLTSVSILLTAWCVHDAVTAGGRTPWSRPAGLATVAATAWVARTALAAAVDDAVRNSTIDLLPVDSVLPPPAAAALLLGLLASAVAALAILHGVWRRSGVAGMLSPGVRRLVVLGLAAMVVPAPAFAAPGGAVLPLLALVGGVVAVSSVLASASRPLRAVLVPTGLALVLVAPLIEGLDRGLRADVERAAERILEGDRDEDRLLVREVLDEIAYDDALRAALVNRTIPRETIAGLWTRSALAAQARGTGIEILPPAGELTPAPALFGAHLPPASWLPVPETGGADGVQALSGRGPGADGRWLAGETEVRDGERILGRARVLLELRRPAVARLPDLSILAPPRPAGSRGRVEPAHTGHDRSGRLRTADSPHLSDAPVLEPARVREIMDTGRRTWVAVDDAQRELGVLVIPRAGDDGGADAFSVEAVGPRGALLAASRAAVGAALVVLAVLLVTAWRWAPRVRLRLSHRLVAALVVVSAAPLLVLAWANRGFFRDRAEAERDRELRESASLLEVVLREERADGSSDDPLRRTHWSDEELRSLAYRLGHHASVYAGPDAATLSATSEPVLVDAGLLPRRLPGEVHRELVLLGRPVFVTRDARAGVSFDVGWAPLRDAERNVVGVVAVPKLRRAADRDRTVAEGVTRTLGLSLVALAASVALGTWLGARLTAPLGLLTSATRRVAAGDLSQPVPPVGRGELGDVVDAFNGMISELAESRERVIRAEKEAAWRDMARQVAHEVKNPLTPMRLAAQHLLRARRDGAEDFDDILARSVDVIVRQTESLQRIATDFRDFARLPARRREPVDVAAALREVLDLHARTPNLTVALDAAPGLPPVTADPDELRRVLLNLVGNAVEALGGRDGRIDAAVAAATGDGGATHLVVTIEDDGPGIPADAMERLFDPSFSTKTGGTGLGLAICKRAVEDLGGTIAIESPPGAGTRVHLTLPATVEPAD